MNRHRPLFLISFVSDQRPPLNSDESVFARHASADLLLPKLHSAPVVAMAPTFLANSKVLTYLKGVRSGRDRYQLKVHANSLFLKLGINDRAILQIIQ